LVAIRHIPKTTAVYGTAGFALSGISRPPHPSRLGGHKTYPKDTAGFALSGLSRPPQSDHCHSVDDLEVGEPFRGKMAESSDDLEVGEPFRFRVADYFKVVDAGRLR
jgi:hypothetical protein